LDHQLGTRAHGTDPWLHRFPRRSVERPVFNDRGEHLARCAVCRDHAARWAADDLAVVLRSREPRRRESVAAVSPCDAAVVDADHRGRDDVLRVVHVHRLSAYLRFDSRWTAQRDALDGYAFVPACNPGRQPGRGRGDRDRDVSFPPGRNPVSEFRPAAQGLAAGRERQVSASEETRDTQGMNYLETASRRFFTLWLPLAAFLFVLLFPFYWMVITTFKPNEELLSREGNPFWVHNPTLAHIKKLLFDTAYPDWLWNTVLVSVVSTFLSIVCSVLAAYSIERLRFRGSRYVGM